MGFLPQNSAADVFYWSMLVVSLSLLVLNLFLWPVSFNFGPKWFLNLDKFRAEAIKDRKNAAINEKSDLL